MFSKSFFVFVALALSSEVFGREQWMERNGRAVVLGHITRRRFGQENPPVIQKLAAACPGAVCGGLSGAAITPLLAAQPECTQQDMADQIIDASKQFDAATQANMLALAIEYRQAEKNTPPDFTTNPPTPRNSVFCQKAPKNSQLNGLVQSQDPANGDVFFDPATGASVKRGAQANTAPFGGAAAPQPAAASNSATSAVVDIASDVSTASATDATGATDCVTIIAADPNTAESRRTAVTVTVSADASASTTAAVDVASSSTAAASTAAATGDAGAIGNFGKCTAPQIEFATGFDNRKETSFQPVDKTSFNHGSAQNIDIITQFECDTLVNTCGADQTAKDTCAKAIIAADAAAKGTGAQADAFNAVFGVVTHFADVTQVDNQGNPVAGTGSGAATSAAAAATTAAATTSAASSASTTAAATTGDAGAIGNFGKCTAPQIEFATGFDNRKETSFQPVDKTSFNHGSAQNIDIITQFECDTLVNTCGADQTAKDTCAKAIIAADAAAKGTGAQADAFNAVFGVVTQFADVTQVDNQGNPVAGTGSGAGTVATSAAVASTTAAAATDVAATTSAASSASTTAAATTGSSSAIGNFGKCTVPQIAFAAGFDNRKETSFEPVDLISFPHGSAQGIDIITRAVCDQLVNSCGADQPAKDTCAKAIIAADSKPAKTGAQADAFNAVFGIKTNFSAVQALSDQGVPV